MSSRPNGVERRRLRYAVVVRDGPECHYCGCVVVELRRSTTELRALFTYSDPLYVTLDHVVPQSQGGRWRMSNLVLSCRHCNELRGDVDYVTWRELTWELRASVRAGRCFRHGNARDVTSTSINTEPRNQGS